MVRLKNCLVFIRRFPQAKVKRINSVENIFLAIAKNYIVVTPKRYLSK